MKTIRYDVDLAVVGGGVAGLCAALAAARQGIKVVLMQDRPVLGGNASSEVRMWICGAHGENMRETGLVEELLLENLYRNPEGNYSVWDSVLYGKARYQENLTLLLNTTCTEAKMEGNRIGSVRGWQLNSETWYEVYAKNFADCSGDSILAPLTGAETRYGREACIEFNEDIAPQSADAKTMGMSCLLQTRETTEPHDFIAPEWAYHYDSPEQFSNRSPELTTWQNFWWIELGGAGDALHDVDAQRDELLKIVFGIWDYLKNRSETREKYRNWELEWVGFLPGKRESRRYVGDIIMNQNDVRAGGKFDDLIAYGGWSMDDHHPDGIRYPGKPTIFHPAPSPYGIPYRALYSRNIDNLFCAGRNISVTHSALSSTRVMATCALLGEAVGVAAAIAAKTGGNPRSVYTGHLKALQQQLMKEDCHLPGFRYEAPELTRRATLTATGGDPAGLRGGLNRVVGEIDESWHTRLGGQAEYRLERPETIQTTRLVFDSNLSRPEHNIVAQRFLNTPRYRLPATLVREFRIEAENADGSWSEIAHVTDNRRRVLELPVNRQTAALRLTVIAGWGNPELAVFAWDFE